MWVSGGRAFQAERTTSAKALGQEHACLRPAWLDLSEEGGDRGQGQILQVCLGHGEDLDFCGRYGVGRWHWSRGGT